MHQAGEDRERRCVGDRETLVASRVGQLGRRAVAPVDRHRRSIHMHFQLAGTNVVRRQGRLDGLYRCRHDANDTRDLGGDGVACLGRGDGVTARVRLQLDQQVDAVARVAVVGRVERDA